MQEPTSIMVKCECHDEALEVTHWPDTNGNGESENEYWFAIWKQGFDTRLCWRERFRWCWNILRTGKPWGDNIILTPENAKQVSEFINQNLKNDTETKK
jgi:hypothetical protein